MISVKKIVLFLFLLLGFCSFFSSQEICFAISVIGMILSLKFSNYNIDIKILISPLSLIFIGLVFSFQNPEYLVFKDVFYFLSPILIFMFGQSYSLHFSIHDFLKHIIFLSLILGFLFLINVNNPENYTSISKMKEEQGVPSYFTIIAFIMIILSVKHRVIKFNFKLLILLIFLSIISILSFSRTFLLSFMLMFIVGYGYLRFNKFFLFKFLLVSLIFGLVYFYVLSLGVTDRTTFIGKISTSLSEISLSDYSTSAEISHNWRGFEAFKGFEQYKKGNQIQYIIGQGFGQTAPLGIFMPLGDSVFSEIPKFHNGYITILLKTGILGLLIYFLFFFNLAIVNLKDNSIFDNNLFITNFLAGLSIVILVSTFVISGWLNKTSMIPFIFSLGYFYQLKIRTHRFSSNV